MRDTLQGIFFLLHTQFVTCRLFFQNISALANLFEYFFLHLQITHSQTLKHFVISRAAFMPLCAHR